MSYYSSPQEPQQFELFNSPDEQTSGKKGLLSKKVSLAIEHLMIAGIVILVLCVIVFSIGVERGKQAVIKKSDDLEINLANSGNDDIIPPSSEAAKPVTAGQPVAGVRMLPIPPPTANRNQEIVVDVPVPVEAKVQEPAADVAVTGVYTVQVASFKQAKFASQEVEILKKRGYEAYSVSKAGFYLVCVGRYKNKTQADKTSKTLKSKYKDNVIRRL